MANSVIKKKGFGAYQALGVVDSSTPFTVPADGLFVMNGIPTSGNATTVIRITVTRNGATLKYGGGSQLGVVATVTVPVYKGDVIGADYAYQCSLSAYYAPLE